MDRPAHQIAKGGIHHAMSGQRQFATEAITDHDGLEMYTILTPHLGTGLRETGFNKFTDGFGVQRAFLIK